MQLFYQTQIGTLKLVNSLCLFRQVHLETFYWESSLVQFEEVLKLGSLLWGPFLPHDKLLDKGVFILHLIHCHLELAVHTLWCFPLSLELVLESLTLYFSSHLDVLSLGNTSQLLYLDLGSYVVYFGAVAGYVVFKLVNLLAFWCQLLFEFHVLLYLVHQYRIELFGERLTLGR